MSPWTPAAILVFLVVSALMLMRIRQFYSRTSVRLPAAEDFMTSIVPVGSLAHYPDRNGHLKKATVAGFRQGLVQLHVGHPHNRPFSRPASTIRLPL